MSSGLRGAFENVLSDGVFRGGYEVRNALVATL